MVVSIPALIKAAIAYSIPPRNGLVVQPVNSVSRKWICAGMKAHLILWSKEFLTSRFRNGERYRSSYSIFFGKVGLQ